jgi:hypothetical protein
VSEEALVIHTYFCQFFSVNLSVLKPFEYTSQPFSVGVYLIIKYDFIMKTNLIFFILCNLYIKCACICMYVYIYIYIHNFYSQHTMFGRTSVRFSEFSCLTFYRFLCAHIPAREVVAGRNSCGVALKILCVLRN